MPSTSFNRFCMQFDICMKDIVTTIGKVITSPYPYFALLGYFGLEAYQTVAEKPASLYTVALLALIISFLTSLSILVYILIRKVGHSSMLPPESQVKVEKMRIESDERKEKVKALQQSAEQEMHNDE